MAGKALKRRLREIWHKLSRLDATPDQIAIGFSIGMFASFLPLKPSPAITAIAVVVSPFRWIAASGPAIASR
jgi:uncharacterized protein (DUF2062 family)